MTSTVTIYPRIKPRLETTTRDGSPSGLSPLITEGFQTTKFPVTTQIYNVLPLSMPLSVVMMNNIYRKQIDLSCDFASCYDTATKWYSVQQPPPQCR